MRAAPNEIPNGGPHHFVVDDSPEEFGEMYPDATWWRDR